MRLIPQLTKIFKHKQKELENNTLLDKVKHKLFNSNVIDYSEENLKNITIQFNERLNTSIKENIECLICITHNPYDVARNEYSAGVGQVV